MSPTALEPQTALDHLSQVEGELLLVGEAALLHRDLLSRALGARAALAPAAMSVPQASLVAEAARQRLASPDPKAAFELRPLYVVPSQAERAAGIDLGLTGGADKA
jgi:tRNA threonylcarbamoyladenosine biosynthesis protein TsaB